MPVQFSLATPPAYACRSLKEPPSRHGAERLLRLPLCSERLPSLPFAPAARERRLATLIIYAAMVKCRHDDERVNDMLMHANASYDSEFAALHGI